MKYLAAAALMLSACAASSPQEKVGPPQPEGKVSWFCHAISAGNEVRAHGEGHGESCEGTEECARKKALESCSRYHKDCEIVFCTD